jgi:hypothetical protein
MLIDLFIVAPDSSDNRATTRVTTASGVNARKSAGRVLCNRVSKATLFSSSFYAGATIDIEYPQLA